jgi:hypothetical protein
VGSHLSLCQLLLRALALRLSLTKNTTNLPKNTIKKQLLTKPKKQVQLALFQRPSQRLGICEFGEKAKEAKKQGALRGALFLWRL